MSSVKAPEMLAEGLLVVSTNCLASGTRSIDLCVSFSHLTMCRNYIDELLIV